ncbi:MAG: PIG-L family deacetylase [Meiothermus sp.]|jgi:LmbE family N-acetylglucosaminyl deacetylase|nr:PIG-L family deacetylase [Meiothermus sp.]
MIARVRRWLRKRYALLAAWLAALVVINAPWIFAWGYGFYYRLTVSRLPQLALMGERLLVLSPHPDDESLCCAGAIQQVLRSGGEVWVLWFTNGDGFEWDASLLAHTLRPQGRASLELGQRRMDEARLAARRLGVPEDHLFFLGYPDRGLEALLQRYPQGTPYRSHLTQVSHVPYPGTLSPGAPYTGESLRHDFRRVLELVRPTLVLAPSPRDAHPDHRAVGLLAQQEVAAERLRFWIVHGGLEWPLPKGLHPQLPLEPAPRGKGLPWQRLSLDAAERAAKLEALRAHTSQMRLLAHFMLAFVRQNELYSARGE